MAEADIRAAVAFAMPGENAPVLAGLEVSAWTYDAALDCLTADLGELRLACTLGPRTPPFAARPLWLHVTHDDDPDGWTMCRAIPDGVFRSAAPNGGGADVSACRDGGGRDADC